jgi:hypothetical protein
MLTFSSYKLGAVACGVGAMICDKTGAPIAHDVFQGVAYCCAGGAAAVTASQAPNFQVAADQVGNAAVAGWNGVITGGQYAAQCISNVCTLIANTVTGARSIDGDILSVREVNVPEKDGNLVARFAELEQESDEDAVLVSRYAEPKPESDEDDLE